MKTWAKRIALTLIVVVMVTAVAFVWWGNNPLEAMPAAVEALASDNAVLVIPKEWIVFSPLEKSAEMGVILYPGGHVDPVAYAPLAKEIAAEGYLVILPRMPLNLAVFDMNVADEIIRANPNINRWVIGGHSLGGAMAAEYAADNPTAVVGLFLWASYSAENTDLSDLPNIKVLSIYGTEDGGVADIRVSRERLPENTTWVEMDGANHAQFGWYGEQAGDGEATISREAQQVLILESTLAFLQTIEE